MSASCCMNVFRSSGFVLSRGYIFCKAFSVLRSCSSSARTTFSNSSCPSDCMTFIKCITPLIRAANRPPFYTNALLALHPVEQFTGHQKNSGVSFMNELLGDEPRQSGETCDGIYFSSLSISVNNPAPSKTFRVDSSYPKSLRMIPPLSIRKRCGTSMCCIVAGVALK
jgi:hypothetical protein